MRIMIAKRMESKNPYQGLFNELKEEEGLSPIETRKHWGNFKPSPMPCCWISFWNYNTNEKNLIK